MFLLYLILTDGEGGLLDLPAVSNAVGFLSLHQEVGERYKCQVWETWEYSLKQVKLLVFWF